MQCEAKHPEYGTRCILGHDSPLVDRHQDGEGFTWRANQPAVLFPCRVCGKSFTGFTSYAEALQHLSEHIADLAEATQHLARNPGSTYTAEWLTARGFERK